MERDARQSQAALEHEVNLRTQALIAVLEAPTLQQAKTRALWADNDRVLL